MGKIEKIALIPDIHSDDSDPRAIDLAAQITEAFKPDTIIFLGDILDAWWATRRFRRDPSQIVGAAVREREMWDDIRPKFKAKRRIVIPGNHDARIIELQDTVPELLGCDDLNLKKILCPSGEEYAEKGFVWLAQGEFVATHGIYIGEASSKKELLRWGTSGVAGHDHRFSRHYQRDSRGVRVFAHIGHLGNNPPRYRRLNDPAPQQWMHGMGLLYVDGNQFYLEDLPFTHHYKAMYGGKKYSA